MSGLLSLLSRQDDALIRRDADELLRLNDLTRPYGPVSYTHLDVYKRQALRGCCLSVISASS